MKPVLFDLPMPIITPRLILRPPQLGDGPVFNAAVLSSLDNIRDTMSWAKEKPTIADSEEFVRHAAANWILKRDEEPYLPLFIFDKRNNFIGTTGFHHIVWEVPSLEVGYWISHQYSGHGLMTEAVNAVIQYAIKELRVKRIAITCDVDNSRSQKIPERLGFHLEAKLKFHRVKPLTGETSDTFLFVIYNADKLPPLNVKWG